MTILTPSVTPRQSTLSTNRKPAGGFSESLRRSLRRCGLVFLATLGALQCSDDQGPAPLVVAQLNVNPQFSIEGAHVVPVAQVRLRILRSDSVTVVVDTTVAIGADSVVELSAQVVLLTNPEQFIIELQIIGPQGNTLFRGGPRRTTVSVGPVPVTQSVEIVIRYTGPGFDAAGVRIVTAAPEVGPGGVLSLTAEAFNNAGAPIPGTPILWSSLDPTVATVPDLESGQIVAGPAEGQARIVARLLTGQADTATVLVRQQIPEITLTPDTLFFEATAGATLPLSQQIQITNTGTPLSQLTGLAVGQITYDQGADWIVGWTLSAGTAPTPFTVFVNPVSLSPGAYTGHIPILAPGASNSPQDLVVVLNVPGAASVTVTPRATTLNAFGATAQLAATALDPQGNPIPGQTFVWTSSAPNVATVGATGLVTAIGNGSATITANAGGVEGTATVTVTQAVNSVVITPSTVTFSALGQTSPLTATALDANANPIAGTPFTWMSDQPAVASVDAATGLVTSLANTVLGGPVTITATTGGVSGTASVTINQNATQISVSPTTATLNPGGTVQVTATVLDANDQPAQGVVVAWSSSNTRATVVSTGPTTALVTASSIEVGTATVTATFGALNAGTAITVNPPTSVTVAPDPVGTPTTLTSFGDSLFFTATALDGAGAPIPGLAFAWQVSNPTVASIVSVGPARAVLVALSDGPVVVTASTVGAVSGTATATVSQVATSISVTPSTLSLNALGRTSQLTGSATDARGNPVPVTWSSSNTTIASVSSTGIVTALANGATTVTATAGALQATAAITVQQAIALVLVTPPTAVTSTIGDTLTLTATARDPLGNVVSGATATWTSANPASASVTSTSPTTALVTALAVSPGVTITATMGVASGVSTVVVGQTVDPSTSTATVPVSGAAGLLTNVTVQSRDASGAPLTSGGATVQVTITGANASGGALTAVDSLNGRYGFQYTPINLGTDNIAITINGVSMGGSPFASTVSPGPVSPLASGTTVPAGIAGLPASLVIIGRDQFGHLVGVGGAAISASLRAGSANAAQPITVVDSSTVGGTAGVYTVTYTPTASGIDSVDVTMNGVTLSGSPFVVMVAPGAVTASTSTATVPGVVTAGIPSAIVVQGRDAAGNPVNVGGATVLATIASGPNVGETFATVDSATAGGTPGVYSLTYTPILAGTDLINITLNGTPIAGTQPFNINVTSGGVSGATSVAQFTPDVATFPGIVTAGTPVRLRVQGKDANGNDVTSGGATVVMNFFSGPNKPAPPLPNPLGAVDNGDGTYDYFYTPLGATPATGINVDSIAVTLNGIPISGSPFGAHVIPSTIDPALTTVEITNDYTSAPVPAGTPVTFTLTTRDQYGNALRSGGASVTASVAGTNGPFDLGATTIDNGDGTYTLAYAPTIVGTDDVTIAVNGVTVQGAPFSGTIEPSYADFTQSTAVLNPGPDVVAGTPTSVTVTAFDSYGNSTTVGTVEVSVTGVNAFGPIVATNNGNGTFTANLPTSSGGPEIATVTPDQIIVQMDGGAGPGSVGPVSGTPFALTVRPGPISATHSVATFVPDIEINSVVAGTQVTVTIQGNDAFGNNVDITAVPAPDRVFTFNVIGGNGFQVPINATDNNDGTWTASYTPTVAGSDILDVRHKGAVGVADNPFSADIVPSTIAGQTSTVTFSPSIAAPLFAGTPLTMTIQGKDIYGNNVDINTVPAPARVFQVNITEGTSAVSFNATDNNDGTWTANYTPTIAGTTIISILHQGTTGGPGNPFSLTVLPLAPAQLEFLTPPATLPLGYPFNPPIEVGATDIYGNVTPSFNETITLRIAPGTGNPQAFLIGPTSAVPINGLASFPSLQISNAGTAYQFLAQTTSFTSSSSPFDITAFGYVVNQSDNTVSVFDALTNSLVGSSIPVGLAPTALAASPAGTHVYVANSGTNDVSVIETVSNTVLTKVPVGNKPVDIAVSPDDKYVYVVNGDDNTVTVFATISLNTVATVPVGTSPSAVAVTPNSAFSYVTNAGDGTVTVINNSGFTVFGSPIPLSQATGPGPSDVGISLNGLEAYVLDQTDSLLYTIDTGKNTILSTFDMRPNPAKLTVVPFFSYVYVTQDQTGTATGNCDCVQLLAGVPDVFALVSNPEASLMYITNPSSNRLSVISIGQGVEVANIPVANPVDVVFNYILPPLSGPPSAGAASRN